MSNKLILRLTVLLACFTLSANSFKAEAQSPAPSAGQAAGIFAILIGSAAGAGVGIYLLVRPAHNVTGCVSAEVNGLQLTDENGKDHYVLGGETAMLKAGDRVRLSGKPGKDANKQKTFLVKKVTKIYGACNPDTRLP
ncbi:hypothetical protein [Occallatibacter riparius]|uniref:DUF5666 domain-containing protein n=1 Tax=Occallatibacter riparius TaxID=1002689 RepID=A0A9J7BYV1_9BACT|nr:hypothetical protein [Occallatibacter riparius]UWZ86606.1 hypothetical protein MOP44_11830 [Occallatibacter riparius]